MKRNICLANYFIVVFIACLAINFALTTNTQAKAIYYNSIQYPTPMSSTSRTFEYTKKEIIMDISLPLKTPRYYDLSKELLNGCAAVAGSIVIGYYDATLKDIIENYESIIKRGNSICFKAVDLNIQLIMNDLYNKMQINHNAPGATEDDFKKGLKEYVENKGYNITYTSYISNSNIDYNAIESCFMEQMPIVLFVSMTDLIVDLQLGDNATTLVTHPYNANHILVANGIKRIKYYIDNTERIDTYLSVSSGLDEFPQGYIWLENTRQINNIVGVEIK